MDCLARGIKWNAIGLAVLLAACAPIVTVPPPQPQTGEQAADPKIGASIIRSQKQCQGPQENYDFTAVVLARFGAEGLLRLNQLLASDFKRDELNPKDKGILDLLSREMLWIPAAVEEKIGEALLLASYRSLKPLAREGEMNGELWQKTTEMLQGLMERTPKNPFKTRLLLLEDGNTEALAGGVVLVDNDTLLRTYGPEKPEERTAAEPMLRFVLAHELAHIHKRHRAKRIQQLLVDTDAGLKLVRLIFNKVRTANQGGLMTDFVESAQMALVIPTIARGILEHHEKYGQEQELEADACAATLLWEMNEDPVAAFRAYRQAAEKATLPADRAAAAASSSLMRSHPPDGKREENIIKTVEVLRAETAVKPDPIEVPLVPIDRKTSNQREPKPEAKPETRPQGPGKKTPPRTTPAQPRVTTPPPAPRPARPAATAPRPAASAPAAGRN